MKKRNILCSEKEFDEWLGLFNIPNNKKCLKSFYKDFKHFLFIISCIICLFVMGRYVI